jgi:integrase
MPVQMKYVLLTTPPSYLKPHEIRKLIYSAKAFRDRCVLKVLTYTAFRRHELVGLDVQDIDFEGKGMTVRKGKSGKLRIVPLSGDPRPEIYPASPWG